MGGVSQAPELRFCLAMAAARTQLFAPMYSISALITGFCHTKCWSLRQECSGLQRMHDETWFLPSPWVPQWAPGCIHVSTLLPSLLPCLSLFRCFDAQISQKYLYVKLGIFYCIVAVKPVIVARGEVKGTPHTIMLLMSLYKLTIDSCGSLPCLYEKKSILT